jgi:hypothetical protein
LAEQLLVEIGDVSAIGKRGRSFAMINNIEIERFSLISFKPFDQVVAALDAGVDHPDMADFERSTHEARSFAELKRAVEKGLSKAGLMLFMRLDHGAVVRKETGRDAPRIIKPSWSIRSLSASNYSAA